MGIRMKYNWLLSTLLFLFIGIGCGKVKKQVTFSQLIPYQAIDTMERVKQIDVYKLEVESLKDKMETSQRDSFETAEGGRIKYFYIKEDTVKKELDYYGETGRKHFVLYQEKGMPLLIEEIEMTYETPLGVANSVEIKDSVVQTFYYHEQKLIYWLKNDQHVDVSKYAVKEGELVDFFKHNEG